MFCFCFFFFFFSSRRRHTRFDCDWSSDVCSSDLRDHVRRSRQSRSIQEGDPAEHQAGLCRDAGQSAHQRGGRSEERRVGKECRSRWSPDHEKKKKKKQEAKECEDKKYNDYI